MKITKYLHSCLLIEEGDKKVLIDPGYFTYKDQVFNITSLNQLDSIFITHTHPDHCYIPFLKDLLSKFPDVQIISNESVTKLLQTHNIAAIQDLPIYASVENALHEKLWFGELPQNSAFTLFNKLTHCGDSLGFSKTAPVLALPLQAPWGSVTQAVEKTLAVKPTIIIPVHDYHWKDGIRKSMYTHLTEFFTDKNITFKSLETGETIEV